MGNAGAGKTTMAKKLLRDTGAARLSLDEIVWADGEARRPFEEEKRLLLSFIRSHRDWVIEGCYGNLIRVALPFCTELRFLNPSVDVCTAHCLSRPWHPTKAATPTEEKAMLEQLVEWIREYPHRDDDCGLHCHREIFEGFRGPKREYREYEDTVVR